MSPKEYPLSNLPSLRQKAETMLGTSRSRVKKMSLHEIQHLVHDLQVHQIELEMQNEELRQAQLDLQQARDRYSDLYDFAPVGFLTLNARGEILEANLTACQLLEVERKALLSQNLKKFVIAADQPTLRRHFDRVKQRHSQGVSEVLQLKHNHAHFLIRLQSLYEAADSQHPEPLFRLALVDLTEQEQAKASQQEQKTWIGAMLDAAMDAIITIDEKRHIVLFNASAEQMFGCVAKEVLGQSIDRFIPQRFRTAHAAHIQNFERGQPTTRRMESLGEVSGLRANGEEFPIEASISKVVAAHGVRFTIILRDITARKEAHEKLEESEHRFRSLVESAPVCIHEIDLHGHLTSINPIGLEMLCADEMSEITGRRYLDLVAPEDQKRITALFQDACLGKPAEFEFKGSQDPHPRAYASSFIPMKDASGNIMKITGVSQDITKRKEAESLLKENRRMLSTLTNNLPGMAYRCRHDKDWTMEFVSEGSNALCGYDPKKLVGEEAVSWWREIIHPEDRQQLWKEVSSAIKASKSYQLVYRIHTADGSEKWVWEQGCRVASPTGELETLEGFITNITAHKQAEALLEGENAILASMARGANLPDTLDKVCLLIEKQCPGIRSSVLILEGSTLRHISSPNMPEGYMQAIDGVTIGPSVGSCGTAAYRREPVIVSDIATDSLWAEYRDLALHHDLRSCWSMPIVSTHDSVLGTFAMYAHEARSPSTGELAVIRVATHLAGITIERNQMEKTLKQAQQLAALGTVASGLAHEIGTPMNIILGRAELLKKKTADVLMQKGLTIIVNQIERITKLMNQLLRFARRSPLEPRLVDLRGVLETTIELIHDRADRSDVTVETCFADECQFTEGDPDQLEQVFLNLLTNAIHAMSDGGVIRIDLSLADARTKVTIADTGTGISKEDLSSIFEPFFTTKSTGKGTGLGLMIVKEIIEQHTGSISVVSEPGQGTTFTILLPHHENSSFIRS